MRTEQIADLIAFVGAKRGRHAVVLGGDFNATPDAPEMAPVTNAFRDAFAAVHGAAADTFTTLNPAKGLKSRRIDYLFVPRKGRPALRVLSSERVFDVPGADGTWPSDHFGVVARFQISD
jgi:endonuclease/exonuclease/phosphatase family metal-dependent hydrolase